MDNELTASYRAAFDAGLAAAPVRTGNGLEYMIVPNGASMQSLPDMRPYPSRKTGTVNSRNVKDFCALVNREKKDESIILCDFKGNGVCRAIIDYHGQNDPHWCEYSVNLVLTNTPEWQAWSAIFGKSLTQVDFAEFLEERNTDVSRPSGADILEVALTLTSKTKVDFMSAHRLSDGNVEIAFREQSETKAGKSGDLEVPSEIEIYVPIYEGFTPQFVKCLLRHRINNGVLSFIVKPMNLATVLRATREQVVDMIRGETGLMVAEGEFQAIGRKV